MDSTSLTFFGLGLAALIGAATIGGWKHKVVVWGLVALAVALFILAATSEIISEAWPQVGAVITALASSQAVWLLAMLVALGMVGLTQVRLRRITQAQAISPAGPDGQTAAADSTQAQKVRDEINALLQRLNAIDGQLYAIEQNLEALSKSLATNADLGKLELKLENVRERLSSALYAFQPGIDVLIATHMAERLDPQATAFAEMVRTGLESERQGEAYDNIRLAGMEQVIRETLMTLGVDVTAMDKAIDRRSEEIVKDAQYLVLSDEDREFWQDGNDKRAWYLLKARLEGVSAAFIAAVDGMKGYSQLGPDRTMDLRRARNATSGLNQ